MFVTEFGYAVIEIVGCSGEGVLPFLDEEVGDPLAASAAADEAQLDLAVGGGAKDRFGGEQWISGMSDG